MRFEAHWETKASPQRVWEVLADGWRYPGWVVGASGMRAVDPEWPAPGARIHHSVGLWPFLIDHAEVFEAIQGKHSRSTPARRASVELGSRFRYVPTGSAV